MLYALISNKVGYMTKHTSALILSLILILTLWVYGCCSHSKGSFFINPSGNTVITERIVVIDELGRLPTVTFPSGTRIVGAEENTLQPGIKVCITEQSFLSQNAGYFSKNSPNTYLYKITAFQESSNSVGNKAYVTTIEKPFMVTLPTIAETGISYVGIRESETDPWRFCKASNQNEILANNTDLRASTDTALQEYNFNLYRLSTSFCLVVYNSTNGNKLPETVVNSLTASSTISVSIKDNKYLEDLSLKGVLKGINLGSINPTDLRARITYRNNKVNEAAIKVNGVSPYQISKADKTVPGYTYYHTFIIDSVSNPNFIGSNGEYSFDLNTSGIVTDSFPLGFLIEFYNKINSEKILPYNYAEFYTINNNLYFDYSVVHQQENIDGDNYTVVETENFAAIENTLVTPEVKYYQGFVLPEQQSISIASNTENKVVYSYDRTISNLMVNKGTGVASVSGEGSYKYGADVEVGYILEDGYKFTGWSGDMTVATFTMPDHDVSMTANASKDTFIVTLEKGTGIADVMGDGNHDYGSIITATCTMMAGYEFDSWSGDFTTDTFTMPASNVTMKANSKPITYTINLATDGGSIEYTSKEYTVETNTFNLPIPTKTGYSFKGWSGSDLIGDENQIVSITQGSTGNKNYTANWSINSYILTLNKNTGISTVDGAGPHKYNSNVTASCTMLAGYDFDFWSGDFTTESFTMPAGNATMTANAKPINYRIDYDLDGGNANNINNYNIESADITLNAPEKQGFDFIGWTGSNGDTPTINVVIPQGSTGNKSYTANYTQRYSITYVLGGGTENTNPTVYNVFTEDIALNNPTLTGYEFTGWSGDDLIGDENMSVTIPQGSTGNRTYTAHYNPVSYSISYNLHGGQLDVGLTNPVNYDITSASILLYKPTRPNHDFIGWEGTDIDGVASDVTILTGSINNRSYVANWSAKAVLTYNLSNSVTIELKRCPAGIFMMGSAENELGHDENEDQHQVTLTRDFYMGTYEVTQEQYLAVMGNNPSSSVGDKKPVEKVNWDNAKAFCDLMNSNIASSSLPDGYYFSLPSDAQWEYACRAGTTESLNSGNNIAPEAGICSYLNELGWYSGNSGGETHIVGQKSPNNWGLYDMHGNVLEWTRDRYRDYYVTVPEIDPEGNSSGDSIVNRGGYYNATPEKCRSAYRSLNKYYAEFSIIGFRLAVVKTSE